MNKATFFLSLMAILCWGFWGYFGKLALNHNMSPATILITSALMGLICDVVIFILFYSKDNTIISSGRLNIYGVLAAVSVAVGLLFYYLALDVGKATVIVPLTSIYPALTTVLSWMFLKEQVSFPQWIGLILIIAGTILLGAFSPKN